MGIPVLQQARIGAYVVRQQLARRRRYPLVLMLEPLFRCNLACAGLRQDRLPEGDPRSATVRSPSASPRSTNAVRRSCRSPAASRCCTRRSIDIVAGIVARRKFVYLCTNALLMKKRLALFEPSPYFVWSVHLDGDRAMHDQSVCETGVYDRAVAAIRGGKGARLPRQHQLHAVQRCRRPSASRRSSTASHATRRRRHHGVAGVRLRARAGPGSISSTRTRTKQLFRDILRRGRGGTRVVVQPVGPVPRLPGRQPELPLHALGQSDAQRVRLAAALLSARRGLRAVVSRADGRDRLGRVRYRQLREVRRLHGAQRLRGDRRAATPCAIR